jgi:hypothetical protein
VSLFRIRAYDDALGITEECGWYATRAGAQTDMDALERESSRRWIASLDDPEEVVEGASPYEWSVEEVTPGDGVRPIDQTLDAKGYIV